MSPAADSPGSCSFDPRSRSDPRSRRPETINCAGMLEQQQTPSGAEPVQGFRDGTEALDAAVRAAVPQSEAPVSESPLPDSPAAPRRKRRLSGAYRDPFIWVTSLAVFCAYLAISLFRLLQLNPSSWDLAIYTEYVKQAASWHAPVADVRTAGFNLLGDHFQPIVMVIAPLFRVFPSPATLVAVQALLAALSVFAVSQAAREKFGGSGSRGFRGRPEPGHRGRVRVLLGPAADGQLRFPRDRLRRPAAGLLPVRAGPRPHQGRGLVGAPAGLRQGGSGLHGGRHRPLPGHRRHARPRIPTAGGASGRARSS